MKIFKTMLLCVMPVLTSAQIAHLQSAGTVGGTLTITPKHTGDLLVVFAGSSNTEDSLTINDSAKNAWTPLNPATSQSSEGIARSWYAISNGTAATNIAVAANAGWQNILFDEFSGVTPANPVDKVGENVGSGTATSTALIPTTNNDLIWAGALGTISSVRSGYNKGADDYSQDWSEYKTLSGSSGSAQTATFGNSGSYIILAALFKPAVSAGSPPAISSFTASPSIVNAGQSSSLSWTSSGATSATLNGGSVAVSGNQVVSPSQNTTYTLVVTNAAGSASSQVTVTINPASTYSISGTVSGSAPTLTLSGAKSATTSTGSGGNYNFSGLANGSYVVAPSQTGYLFSPATSSVTVNGGAVTGVNFAATMLLSHSVSLSWVASVSPNISGYNLYRGTASGGPYAKVNSGLLGSLSYVDSSVAPGQTYYYVSTAVDSSNNESGYSNEASAAAPVP